MNLNVLHRISYGVYIVTSRKGDSINGQIANSVMQVTSKPPAIAVAINKLNLTYDFIKDSKVFAITILDEDAPLKLIGQFGFNCGRDMDKFSNVQYTLKETLCPIIQDHSLGYIELEVKNELDVGTHTIFIGEIVDAEVSQEGEPMTYSHYHKVKGGTTPKSAPIFVQQEKQQKDKENYICTVCGYIYNPEDGDPENGVSPGTSFEDIPRQLGVSHLRRFQG